MIPSYPDFKPLEPVDMNLLFQLLAEKNPEESELSAVNLFIWKDFDRPQLTMIDQNLCILLKPRNEAPFFLEPIGHHRLLETLDLCLKHAARVSRVSERFAEFLPQGAYRLSLQRGQFDYVYLREELAELKGKKFDGKRNHIKKFKGSFPDSEFIPLLPRMRLEACELFESWADKHKDSIYFERLAYKSQKAALGQAFDLFDRLPLKAGAIRSGRSLKGFIIGSPLNAKTITVHFQYGDLNSPGIGPALLWEASNKLFADFVYINLEQDLGIPGLRTAKLSYHPLKLMKKFQIEPAA